MKCPHCGKEVKPGTLFCPKCLTEIQWVPEYNTVETLIRQKEKERDHTKKTETKTKKLFVIGKMEENISVRNTDASAFGFGSCGA